MSPSDETSVSPPTSTQTSQTFHTNMMQSKPSKPSSLPPLNLWCDLPLEIGSIICEYLDVDYCGYLFMISKTWSILPTKKVYHQHCLAIFLSQTFKKIMNISYWGTWKKMLIDRPRLRTNGIYSLRTSFWKPPVNDRFWEEKIREFHEVKFYRHFRFFNDEKVLYSLCNTSCYDIHPQLQYYQGNPAKKIYEGTYQLTRDVVIVKVRQASSRFFMLLS